MIKLIVSEYCPDTVEIIQIMQQNAIEFEVTVVETAGPFGCPRIEFGSIVASGLDACLDLLETVA